MMLVGVNKRRERERQALRARIRDAARALFVAQGYQAVTLRKIAKEIEYSTSAIYVHFRDKEALIEELIDEDFRSHARHFQRASAITDPFERLERVGELYVDFARLYPNHYKFMFLTDRPNFSRPDPSSADQETDATSDDFSENSFLILLRTVTACIETGRLADEFSDPHQVAHMLWSAVHGAVSLELILGTRIELPPMAIGAKHVMNAVVSGMLRRPTSD